MGVLPPRGVWVTAGFFAAAGALEIGSAFLDDGSPGFWAVWDASLRGALHFFLALGLWRRIALCRSIAMVYCLAALVTYGFVIGLALAQAPLGFPRSVRVGSLFQVPSCALLLPFLRSPRAAALFPRPLFRR